MAEKAIEFWRSLDLVGFQKDLDKDAEEITKRREEAEVSRRELVEVSQSFRASASDVILVLNLLKFRKFERRLLP